MPQKPPTAASASGNRLFHDLSKLSDELELPLVAKPTPGSGVEEDFNKIDLPNLSSKSLSRYLQYSSGMHSFALVCCANAENKSSAIHEALTRRTAELRILFDDAGKQKYKVDAEVSQDDKVIKLQDAALKADAAVRLYKAYCAAFESRANLLSREISRRSSEALKGQ